MMERFEKLMMEVDWVGRSVDLLSAFGILILGWIFSKWVSRLIRKKLGDSKGLEVNDTVRPVIAIVAKYSIMLAAIYAALKVAGIPSESLLAVFGAAGLAIALAVQGTLSNVAAGMMLIFLRAIKVGEYIETPSFEGSVLEIGLFTTQIKDPNGVYITVPNAQIWSSQIKNYSRFKTRRISVDIEIARDNDVEAALATLEKCLQTHDAIINRSAAGAVVTGFTPTSVKLQARCWMKSSALRSDSSSLRTVLHKALREDGYKLPPAIAVSAS